MIKFNKTQHGMTKWKKQDQKIKKKKKQMISEKSHGIKKKNQAHSPKTSPHA
jgi:hypothetical protein